MSKHGHAKKGAFSPTYQSWSMMMQRCTNPARPYYHCYGGRGIKVCARWTEFKNFLEDMGERPHGKTLDRIDNNGDYEPSNCRWADATTQMRNTRRAKRITINCETRTLYEWCDHYNISVNTVRDRVKFHGMTYEEAITTSKQAAPFAKL